MDEKIYLKVWYWKETLTHQQLLTLLKDQPLPS